MYKKANPRADINPNARDTFWDEQEVHAYCMCVYCVYILCMVCLDCSVSSVMCA